MIVSFHPLFEGNVNILCAGRDPGPDELAAIRSAAAVILPQGCTRPLFEMAEGNCAHVFPNYAARFGYPGKTGQIRLFRETGTPPGKRAFRRCRSFPAPAGSRLCRNCHARSVRLGWEGDTASSCAAGRTRRIASDAAAFEATANADFRSRSTSPCKSSRGGRHPEPAVFLLAHRQRAGRLPCRCVQGAAIDACADPVLEGQVEAWRALSPAVPASTSPGLT